MPRKSPHLLLPPRCLSRAMLRHFIKVSLSNDLLGKQIPPAFSARARTASSEKAVMKMMDTWCPCASKRACSSTPLMAGIWTFGGAHQRSFHRSLQVDDDFRERYQRPFDTVICGVAVALQGRYVALLRRVEELAAMSDRKQAIPRHRPSPARQFRWRRPHPADGSESSAAPQTELTSMNEPMNSATSFRVIVPAYPSSHCPSRPGESYLLPLQRMSWRGRMSWWVSLPSKSSLCELTSSFVMMFACRGLLRLWCS